MFLLTTRATINLSTWNTHTMWETVDLSESIFSVGLSTGNPGPGFVLLGTRQQGVPVILKELVLPGGFDLVSPSFTVRDPLLAKSCTNVVSYFMLRCGPFD
ncbi:unnamed protein product [Schistosoma margrebowiei]|uniref:Uncharacterized protein n=1 Tax=Schistosoma margrebowiei TaxID=48269 RepID=A0A183LBJ4_9TREM|nr:unnamed protein product [Schistosoma margrebowiei]